MRTAAILTAAGSGSRLGHRLPKALVPLDGTPLVTHAARRLVDSDVVDLLVVTAPPGHLDDVRVALDGVVPDRVGLLLTDGGPSRQASVAAALALVPPDVDAVLVHDAARALAPVSLVRRVAAAVGSGHGAVIPAIAVTDTVAQVGPAARADDDAVPVLATPDRTSLRLVQTPQGFRRALLVRAHAAAAGRAGDEAVAATDDSSLVALLGAPVVAVTGDPAAMKITTAGDLAVAGLVLAGASPDAVAPLVAGAGTQP
ncbi:2-C-methyl-D-erythritol 4-phosphate cytidylyltransferase [uncultured Cellulomonas sp.]|uniref:IspD/TarI family cytidylyltransferase n=1 Tax=uncultured Cellulomonas sp. TaxID=189682 RepID=UPI00261FEE51|nr:2-C-methyl-D-erythritol 4-phosphate cytidylyltransferase [uncultured Cellulomonas sp.]